jgi:hypothetical protein
MSKRKENYLKKLKIELNFIFNQFLKYSKKSTLLFNIFSINLYYY